MPRERIPVLLWYRLKAGTVNGFFINRRLTQAQAAWHCTENTVTSVPDKQIECWQARLVTHAFKLTCKIHSLIAARYLVTPTVLSLVPLVDLRMILTI